MAVVREGVEADVDPMIKLQIPSPRLMGDEFDPLGCDALRLQKIARVLTMASLRSEQEQARAFDLPQHLRP